MDTTELYLKNLCVRVHGIEGEGVANGLSFGRGTGLTDEETNAALRRLTSDGYITIAPDYRVTLTLAGSLWFITNRQSLRGSTFRESWERYRREQDVDEMATATE